LCGGRVAQFGPNNYLRGIMLSTSNLHFRYPDGRAFSFPDLQCAAGQTLLVTGQSGCGKTTLLHVLAGILKPESGSVQVGDTRLEGLSSAQTDRFRGQNIGLIYQKSHFLAALSVLDNLLLAPFFAEKKSNRTLIHDLAERLGIGHTLAQLPARLSIGEQQRVSIVRALVNQPRLILADEPTSALDDVNCEAVIRILREQAREQGAALVVVTHDSRLKSVVEQQVELGR
jgi:ABC-type lipoprotein export system ATPase subunit